MPAKFLAGTALVALMASLPAASYGQGVADRPRPEYDAKGIPLESFRIFPTLLLKSVYDDNVFSAPAAQDDFAFSEAPAVRIASDWGRHYVDAYAGLSNFNYAKNSRLDLRDFKVGADGRYDISRSATMSLNASYGEFHESLGSPNTVGFQLGPNRFKQGHILGNLNYAFNRLTIDLTASLDRIDFENTGLIGGGTLLNGDRSEDLVVGTAKVSYSFSPGYSVFASTSYDGRHFDKFLDRAGFHRNSNGYRIDGGLDLKITDLLQGTIYGGYLEQNYAKNVPKPLRDVNGIDFGGTLDWFPDPLVTVHLNAAHLVSDSTLSGVSASSDENVSLSADYEFQRNIIVSAYGSYSNSSFVGSVRSDSIPGAGLNVKYLANRYASLDLSYTYMDKISNVAGRSYSDNTIGIGLNLHL